MFRWIDDIHRALINNLKLYKTEIEFNGIDFDADRNSQYKAIRRSMAHIFTDNVDFFGPEELMVIEPNVDEAKKKDGQK